MAAALAESRVVISADTDFGELLVDRRNLRPSFVLFRRHGRTPEVQSSILLANLEEVEEDLVAGAVVVIAKDRIRVRRLPIR
jgi:predicted nuclease of predicted toxin-antitoxin system